MMRGNGYAKMSVLGLALIFLTGGCLSFEITTEPTGADITFDGEYLGKSPCTGHETARSPSHVYTITARMKGYKTAVVSFPNSFTIQAIPSIVHIPLEPMPAPVQPPVPEPAADPVAALSVFRVGTVPARIPAGATFDLETEFRVTDPSAGNSELAVEYTYKILQSGQVLVTAPDLALSVTNGQRKVHTVKGIVATSQPGVYQIEAVIHYRNHAASRSVTFTVE